MRYEKPIAMNLSARAASGQGPLACIAGNVVTPPGGCTMGSTDAACYTGTGGITLPADCLPGTGAGPYASCLAGNGANWECAAGASPVYGGTCTVGPSNL